MLRMGFERQFIDSNIHAWNNWGLWSAEARRRLARGDVALELIGAHRFNNADFGVALDGTLRPVARTELRLRTRIVPGAQVLPEQDIRLTLSHGIPSGWEASLGYRYLGFSGPDIHAFGADLERPFSRWAARLGGTYTSAPDADALFLRATVRLLLPAQDGHVEVTRGTGERAVLVAIGPMFGVRESRVTGIRARLFPFGDFGLSAHLLSYSFDSMPSRIALATAVLLRW